MSKFQEMPVIKKKTLFLRKENFIFTKKLFLTKVPKFLKETSEPGALCWCFFAYFGHD